MYLIILPILYLILCTTFSVINWIEGYYSKDPYEKEAYAIVVRSYVIDFFWYIEWILATLMCLVVGLPCVWMLYVNVVMKITITIISIVLKYFKLAYNVKTLTLLYELGSLFLDLVLFTIYLIILIKL